MVVCCTLPSNLSILCAALCILACASCSDGQPDTSRKIEAPVAPGDERIYGSAWQRLVERAQQEGKVVVVGIASSRSLEEVFDVFSRRFGIEVELSPGTGSSNVQRILAERARGRFSVDVSMIGPTSSERLSQAGVFVLLEPLLVHPDVADRSRNWLFPYPVWSGTQPGYVAAYLVRIGANISEVYYNTDLVSQEEIDRIESLNDLNDPRWRGRIVAVLDPRTRYATSHWRRPWQVLGPDWFAKFLRDQRPVLLNNGSVREVTDGLGHGKYALGVFLPYGARAEIEKMARVGIPVREIRRTLKEGARLSTGGSIAIFDRAPNPNAAALFVNWYLSHDGQETRHTLTREADPSPSLRTDVSQGRIPDAAWRIFKELNSASQIQTDPELDFADLEESANFIKAQCAELHCYGY